MMRLNSQANEALVVIRSNMHVYKQNPRTGAYGWSEHPVSKLWSGYELRLAHYGLACAEEMLSNRALAKADPAGSLERRRLNVGRWRGLVRELEDAGFSDDLPPLFGDEEFHSAFRALLLYKDIQAQTFKLWKAGRYPNHVIFNDLPIRKASWKRELFERIWNIFGRPQPPWYGQFGWTEEPNDRLVFYGEDREPYYEQRMRRRAANPIRPYLKRAGT
jgi:hypothetical protein